MNANWRKVAIMPVLGMALVLSSCTGNQSELITGPSKGLDRRVPTRQLEPPLHSCEVKALDFFGGDAMPFVVGCEDMYDATLQITSEEQNDAGCMVTVSGVVSFPGTTGHSYNFTASTGDCQHDGGKLKVCSSELGGCVQISLPFLQIVEPRHARSPVN